MTLLSDELWNEIRPVFIKAYPFEAVVAIFPDGTWREIENINARPFEAFSISLADKHLLMEQEPSLFLHSHPNGRAWPSDEDTEEQQATGWNWGIVAIHGQPLTREVYQCSYPEMLGPDVPAEPLEGRKFLWGIRDCWTLAWDYYRAQGHELPAIPRVRKPGAHHTDPRKVDPFIYWVKRLGFEPVSRLDREPGDLVIMRWSKPYRNHVAVYLGDSKYLHQPESTGLSGIETFHDEERLLARFSCEFWRLPK